METLKLESMEEVKVFDSLDYNNQKNFFYCVYSRALGQEPCGDCSYKELCGLCNILQSYEPKILKGMAEKLTKRGFSGTKLADLLE